MAAPGASSAWATITADAHPRAVAELACVAWECVSALLFAAAVAPVVTTSPWPGVVFGASLAANAALSRALLVAGPWALLGADLLRAAGWAAALAPVVDRAGPQAMLGAAAFGWMASGVRRAIYRRARDRAHVGDRSADDVRASLADRLAESALVVGVVAGHILMLFLVAFLRATNEQVRNAWWQVLPWLALGGTFTFTAVVRRRALPVLGALAAGDHGDPALLADGIRRATLLPEQLALVNFCVWLASATVGAFGFRTIFGWSRIDAAIVLAIGVLFAWAISFYQAAWHRSTLAPAIAWLRAWTGGAAGERRPGSLRRRMLLDFGMPLVFSITLSLIASIGLYRTMVGEVGASPKELLALVGSFASLVVAAGVIVARVARDLSRPMSALARAADQVARGRLDAVVPRVDGPAEVTGLGESVERMRDALAHTIGELSAERAGLEEKVAARTVELSRALDDLKHAQAALLHGEKMASLGQLVAGLAHEINNPLNAIAGSVGPLPGLAADVRRALDAYRAAEAELSQESRTELARLRAELDLEASLEDLAGIAQVIRRSTDRAVGIVHNLLSFSRASAERVPTDLHTGIDETLALLGSHLRAAGVTVEKVYAEAPEVLVRPGEVNQVFMNLLTNALQAVEGRSPARIRVVMAATSEAVEVAIEDTGPGVPEELRTRIFDPFFTTKPAGRGTGLGLSISAQIAARHGGSLTVSAADGGGARFVLRIPLERPSLPRFPSP